MTASPPAAPSPIRLVAMAASATLVGVGLGRFAYAALLPGVIQRGWHRTLIAALTLKGTGVLLPLLVPGLAAVTASSFLVGAMIPTMVSGIMGRTAELVPPRLATQVWGRATALWWAKPAPPMRWRRFTLAPAAAS